VGSENREKENHAMTRLNGNRTDATKQQPSGKPILDAYLIDDEFDDFLDHELLAIRETFADFCNY
jgi:hypothetical protein